MQLITKWCLISNRQSFPKNKTFPEKVQNWGFPPELKQNYWKNKTFPIKHIKRVYFSTFLRQEFFWKTWNPKIFLPPAKSEKPEMKNILKNVFRGCFFCSFSEKVDNKRFRKTLFQITLYSPDVIVGPCDVREHF